MLGLSNTLLAFLLTGLQPPVPAPRLVESVEVVVEDVFEENGAVSDLWLYRAANRLHLKTRERIIRQELLFAEGETVTAEDLAQTERNLRALPFLRLARVEVTDVGDDRVRVRVVTSDAWSTLPEFRISKVGNRWLWSAGASEQNLLGYGKQLRIARRADLDRDQTILSYRDPRFMGSRVATTAFASDATDGHHLFFSALRPFFSVQTSWSARAQFEDFDRLDPLYEDGERVDDLTHLRRRVELDLARAVRRTTTSAVRAHIGYDFTEDDIDAGLDFRRFGMLRVGVSSISHRFLKLTHVNRFERPEDVNLGGHGSAFIGWSTASFGGEGPNALFYFLNAGRGFGLGRDGFVLTNVSWQARDRDGDLQNSFATVRVNGVHKLTPRSVLLAKAELRHGYRLDPEVQIRLGAESGLRGYPVRQFNGDRSLLVSAEARWFLADDVANLVSFGVAAFADSGYAWPTKRPMRLHDLRSDLGFSFLIGGSRGAANRPGVRIDFAYALDPIEGRSRWVVSAGSRIGF